MTSPFMQIVNPGGLTDWHQALRGRARAQATAVVFSDSIGEGDYAGTPIYQNRWIGRLQTALRAAHPTPGTDGTAPGFMPGYYADGLLADETTRSGGGTFTEQSWIWGPGGKALGIPGTSTGTVTFPAFTITSFRVWYGKTNFLGGTGRARVDTVNQTPTMNGSAGAKSDGHYQDYAVTAGAHVVDIQNTATSSQFFLDGVQFFNGDEDRGVHIIDGTHSGMNSTHLIQSSMDPMWAGFFQAMKPRLFVIALGSNDYNSRTAAEYLANIDTLLGKIETAMGALPYSVALMQPYHPGNAWNSQVWADMMTGLAARATGNVASIDIQQAWPNLIPDGSTNSSLMYESTSAVHPNAAGHARYAELMTDALSLPESRTTHSGPTYLPGNTKARLP